MGALHCYIETTRMIQKRTLIRNVVSGRSLCPDRAVSDRSDDISDKPRALIVNECKLHQLLSRHFGSPLHFNILRINADGGLQERCGFPLTVSNTETESNYMRRLLLTKIQPCVSQTDINVSLFIPIPNLLQINNIFGIVPNPISQHGGNRLIAGLDKQARHKPTVRFGGIYNEYLVHLNVNVRVADFKFI